VSFLLVVMCAALVACEPGTEVGFAAGAPLNLGVDYRQPIEDGYLGIKGGLAWGGGAALYFDYIFSETPLATGGVSEWMFYWGTGIRMLTSSLGGAGNFGIRVPLGVLFDFGPGGQKRFFAEAAPGLSVSPGAFTADLLVGMRFSL
jgi:hypothetical protein